MSGGEPELKKVKLSHDNVINEPGEGGVGVYHQPKGVSISHVDKSHNLRLSKCCLHVSGMTNGYSSARCSHGVSMVSSGTWYCEYKITGCDLNVKPEGGGAHVRVGWATSSAELEAPVGFDMHGFGYCNVDGSKITKGVKTAYGDPYSSGDVIGMCVKCHKQGSWYEIQFFKNGVDQGVAFVITEATKDEYFPIVSLYYTGKVTFQPGPAFQFPIEATPLCSKSIEDEHFYRSIHNEYGRCDALLFNFNGTIVDNMEFHFEAYRSISKLLDLSFSRKDVYDMANLDPMITLRCLCARKGHLQGMGKDELRELLEKAAREKMDWYYKHSEEKIRDFQCTTKLVKHAKRAGNIKLAVVAIEGRKHVIKVLKKLKLHKFFDIVVAQEDFSLSQADIEMYKITAKHLGVPPERCQVYDHSLLSFETIRKAKMHPVDIKKSEGYASEYCCLGSSSSKE